MQITLPYHDQAWDCIVKCNPGFVITLRGEAEVPLNYVVSI